MTKGIGFTSEESSLGELMAAVGGGDEAIIESVAAPEVVDLL
jgi:hypothetical protein